MLVLTEPTAPLNNAYHGGTFYIQLYEGYEGKC